MSWNPARHRLVIENVKEEVRRVVNIIFYFILVRFIGVY